MARVEKECAGIKAMVYKANESLDGQMSQLTLTVRGLSGLQPPPD